MEDISSSDLRVRDAALEALYSLESSKAREIFSLSLRAPDVAARLAAFTGYVRSLDTVERTILSRDVDGIKPFIDPASTVGAKRVKELASATGISPAEVEEKLLAVSNTFGLRLLPRTRGRRPASRGTPSG